MYAAKDKEGDQEKNTLPRTSHHGGTQGCRAAAVAAKEATTAAAAVDGRGEAIELAR
jgi:hypothetical protein